MGRRDHPREDHAFSQAQRLDLGFQRSAVRAVPHQQEPDIVAGECGGLVKQFADIFLLCQTAHIHHDEGILGDAQAAAQNTRLDLIHGPGETAQVDACGDHVDGAVHLIPLQQTAHLDGRGDDAGGLIHHPPGKDGHSLAAPAAAGGEVMGIVFVHGMVGVDHGGAGEGGELPGDEECGKFTLGVDDIGSPRCQFLQKLRTGSGAQPAPG